ncbi:MAG: hypothetical protein ACOYOB_19965, partial [Myxococcota bacterium]
EVEEASRRYCFCCRQKNNARPNRYRLKAVAAKESGLCTVAGCRNVPELGRRKCSSCLAYMRAYKVAYREKEKAPNTCSATDCQNPRDSPRHTRCGRCRERGNATQRASTKYTVNAKARRDRVRADVFGHYGTVCACCGEARDPFLQIDHIDGTGYAHVDRAGRRVAGGQLYAQLKRTGYPTGYRVLCSNCNFALGHHGYCPHGWMTQDSKRGRPALHPQDPQKTAKRREYWQKYKLEVLSNYGDGCACCGEKHKEFLSIEHLNQTGAARRKELTGSATDGRNFLVWLRRNGYPAGYGVLCMSCNFATRLGAACPHTA